MTDRTQISHFCIRLVLSFFTAQTAAMCTVAPTAPKPQRTGAEARFQPIARLVRHAVDDGTIPGAVVLIGHNGRVVYRHAFGSRSLDPTRERMTADTVFDMASLTKCIVTATSVMQLIESGQVRLNDRVSAYLPDFAQNGKQDITVRELLTHYSGLAPDLDLKEPWSGRETAFRMAVEQWPEYPPGTRFLYSDINFETLGFLIEKVTGQPLNEYAEAHIFKPLGMRNTRFLPPPTWSARIAPTQYDENGQMLRGTVHDPTARRMGGVAGHAGLFSNADDLSRFAQQMLAGHAILSRLSIVKMTTPQQPANSESLRGLGWDIDSPFSSNRGELLPVGSFGHTGFTGTSLWIDPVTNTYIILLTNAVHPRGGKSVVSLRSRLATAVVQALDLTVSANQQLSLARVTGYNESIMAARRFDIRNGEVKIGIDVLEAHNFRELKPDSAHPLRLGLVTNQTGVDSNGHRTIDLLVHAPGIKLAAIFSPEHGISGMQDTTQLGNSTDAPTGVPVISVYGETDASRRPSPQAMEGIDAIVYDIQDIGVRFYTYESTLGYFLEAAATAGKPLYVLDRPNPITGAFLQGPIADPGRESFVSYWQIPVRHGMTVGELARMFNAERNIRAQLTVVPMEGWQRGDWWDSTGASWINPSPNIRRLNEAILYPGIGMIETTNISVGRGTDTPFEVVGAPWVDGKALARYLNRRAIPGVRFVPAGFTPASSVYANEKCGGINLIVTARDALDSPEMGLEIASALQGLYPTQYKIAGLDKLMVNKAAIDAVAGGVDPRTIAEQWQDSIQRFESTRSKYLLY